MTGVANRCVERGRGACRMTTVAAAVGPQLVKDLRAQVTDDHPRRRH